MTTERIPTLESLFAAAGKDLPDDDFVEQVMLRVDKLRRRALVGWIFVGLAAVMVALMLTGPLVQVVSLATEILPKSLVEVDDLGLAQVFSPANSIAGAVGLGLLGLRTVYRKIFAHR